MKIVDFAYQVIEMNEKIRELEFENERLRQYEHDYYELLNSSLSHNQEMIVNTLRLAMTPRVVESCQEKIERLGLRNERTN